VSTGLLYLAQVLLARWLEPATYGTYIYTYAWMQILAVLGGLGLTTGVLRFIPYYFVTQDWGRLRGLIRRSRQLTFLSGGMLAVLSTAVLCLVPSAPDTWWPLLIGVWVTPLLGLSNLMTEMLRGTEHIVLAYMPPLVLYPLLVIGMVYLVRSNLSLLSGTGALAAVALALLVILSVQAGALMYALPTAVRQAAPVYETSLWLHVSLPLLFVMLCSIFLKRIDLLLVGMLLGQQAAGIYDAASKTAMLASFLLTAINAVAAPRIAALHAGGDHAALQRLVHIVTQWMWWPSLVITFCLFCFGESLLGLFGPEFVTGLSALKLLAIGQLVNAATGPVGYLMSLTGHQNTSARILGVSVLVSLALHTLLIPFFALEGAAGATMLSMCLWNIWLCVLVRKRLRIRTFAFRQPTLRRQ
jgi:O-antigen/teichoic acid export membrane protein